MVRSFFFTANCPTAKNPRGKKKEREREKKNKRDRKRKNPREKILEPSRTAVRLIVEVFPACVRS